jgi:nucleoside-diphosphate-sugar epimerase
MIYKDIKILLTGGSGFIGTNIVSWLINNNYAFINIDITPPKNTEHEPYWEKIDIRKKESILSFIKDYCPTHILNLAADLGMDHKNMDNLQTNIKGVENIIQAINNVNTVKRAIFTSSLLVCENGYVPKSNIEYSPPNYYGESKVLGEKIIRSSNIKCEWAIVRPTSIWGPWFDYSYRTFFKMIDKNRYFHIGKSEFQKPASFVGNATHMFMKILLAENSTINKNTFYLADYPWYSTKKWAISIQKTLNLKPLKTAPLWILRFIALMGDIIKSLFKYDPPLTTFRLNNMLTGGAYSVENTKRICGKLPFNIDESVFITAKWMYDNNLIKHKPEVINSEQ